MAYRREAFRDWFAASGRAANTVSTHISILNSVDAAFDLDAKLSELGTDAFLAWVKVENTGPFEKYPSNSRSACNRYVEFLLNAVNADHNLAENEDLEFAQPLQFNLEREMQQAVRKQLEELEPGLTVVDGGNERSVATGKIDIVARDANGCLTVIELKAGLCPSSALEQVLGYADALAEEENEPVRAFLIAGEFSDRTRAAARRTVELSLRTYEFSMKFSLLENA